MEWNQQTVEFLSTNFLNTLSPNPEPRRKSESELSTLSTSPNYALLVLRLVSEPSIDPQIRLAASVNLKNHIKLHWANPDDPAALSDSEKEQIKSLIVPIMLGSTPLIQSQLSEALSIIGKSDFPKRWPGLLPELVLSLGKAKEAGDWVSVNGILSTANTLFKKFRFEYKTNDLLLDLKYCLDNFCEPLLRVFLSNGELIEGVRKTAVGNVGDLRWVKGLFESQRLCCRIFYSLNFQELPEFFEDHMEEWMGEFRKYLVESYPVLEGSEEGVGVVDGVRAAVCENICLYMEKNEEEFQKYLEGFALAVWGLLGSVSQLSSRDRLAITAIKFLTTVSTSVHHGLFAADQVIPQICQNIVIPNVKLRDEDEELFDMNYVEFIRRDMEGSDLDTRRRIACELLKGIATNYKKQVIDIVSAQIQSLLSSFAANPGGNWKDKDCAIYLVVSLATKKAAGNYVTTDIVDVESFFTSVIVPELRSQEVNAVPMLKAGALKFFTMFRYQLSKPVALALLPDVVRYLQSESNVVHSYAASCIEKLLLVKDEGGRARYTSADINPFLLVLMTNLFNALKFPESEENQYVMKCIMRVLGVADISPDIASPCIAQLTSVLGTVCNNPKNPAFNHYLFESVAVLVRRTCEKDASLISAFETSLFPSLQMILTNDVTEFLPYAFQILAQLVELNRSPIPDVYMQIFGLLLSPDLWKRSSNVPALVRLLQAFLQKAPRELNQQGRLNEVLGICQMLVSVSSTDEQGFYILNTIIEYLEFDALSPYVGQIWNLLFQRLQNKKTVKFIKGLLIFMSLFVVKHGSARLVDTIRALQANLIFMILEVIWIPNLKVITGAIEVKLTAVASTKLICETPFLLDAAAVTHWGKMLDSIVTLVSRPEEDRVQEEPDMPDFTENVGYSATFVQLYNAGKKEEDPLKDIKNPKEFLVASLAKLSTLHPGRFPTIINQNLESANQAALLELCKTYNCLIV